MDHYSFLIDSQHIFLLFGIAILVMAGVFTLTGQTIERRGMVYRAEEPNRFWWNVASFYLLGLFFIGVYLYKISN